MSDKNNPAHRSHREITSNIEEDDLWEMDDDWASDEDDAIAEDTPAEAPISEILQEEPVPPSAEINEQPAEAAVVDVPAKVEEPVEEQTDTPSSDDTAEPAADTSSPDEEKASQPDAAPAKKFSLPALSLTEKVSLLVIAFAFLTLGISSYVWLYKKNQTTKNDKLELPANGEHVSISGFSTYWTTAKSSHEIKMGARVLPAADITLSSENNTSGALRINFHNNTDDIIGDPITLTVKDGKFTQAAKANITISNDGLTAHVIASDGFHQEGDYSAYVLDEDLLWKIFVYEAGSASSAGSSFEKLLEYKVEPKRR